MPASKAVKKTPAKVETKVEPEVKVEVKAPVKKTTSKKVEKQVVEPVTETPVVTQEVQNVVVNSDTEVSDGFSEFISKFQTLMSQFSNLKSELKVLERKTTKQLKVVQKINNKKKRKGLRPPSGFVKPSPISDELASFLGKEKGVEMARTDVTREINKYIRANNLQDKDNGRKINPDDKLRVLLKITDDVNLTYFNLQRYMGPHFPKQIKPEVTTSQ